MEIKAFFTFFPATQSVSVTQTEEMSPTISDPAQVIQGKSFQF